MIEDFHTRKEVIVILPYNTLRVTDMILNMEFRTMAGLPAIPDGSKFSIELPKLIYRKEKDFYKFYKIDDNSYNEFIKVGMPSFYNIAPKTDLCSIGLVLQHRGADVIALFDDKRISDDTFRSEYYDGSIGELEKFLVNNKATALFVDDLNIVKAIIERKNIDLLGFTFFISEMGYNLHIEKDKIPQIKDYEKLRNPDVYELVLFKLYKYKKENNNG